MKYSKFSQNVASYLASELGLEEEKQQIIGYAVEILILDILGFILILAVGACLKSAFYAGIAGISGGLLRRLSGGAHLDNPIKCLVFGAIMYGILGFTSRIIIEVSGASLSFFLNLGLLLSFMIVYLYAPVDSAAKPIRSIVLRKKLKYGSVAFLLAAFALFTISGVTSLSVSFLFGIFYQVLTLLPFFNKRR